MADISLRPRSATEIVDAAFQLYRRHAAPIILVTAIAYAPSLVIGLLIVGASTTLQGAMLTAPTANLGLIVVGAIVGLITFSLMSGVLARVGSEMYLGREPDLAGALRTTFPRVPALIGATFLKSLAIGAVMIPVGIVAALVGGVAAAATRGQLGVVVGVVLMVGLFAAIATAVLYMFARLFATTPLVVLETRGAVESLTRSGKLSEGRKRHIAGTLALVFVIYIALYFGVVLVAQLSGSPVVQLLALEVFYVLAYPIYAMTEMLLYYDARIRAEAFDVEVLAGALDPARPAAAATR